MPQTMRAVLLAVNALVAGQLAVVVVMVVMEGTLCQSYPSQINFMLQRHQLHRHHQNPHLPLQERQILRLHHQS